MEAPAVQVVLGKVAVAVAAVAVAVAVAAMDLQSPLVLFLHLG
jgi:hypothetical protein